MSTYIFDGDDLGQRFLRALREAVDRGIAVRLLIDDVGARYSWPSVIRKARSAGIPVAQFMPLRLPWLFPFSNLRNHRKILVVDGRVGFTGGLNIRLEHCLNRAPRHPIRDLHFRLSGPVVGHLQATFARDWLWTTGERLSGSTWFPEIEPSGTMAARGIADGPDDDLDKLRLVLLGAIASAQSSITIMTPYFLPDATLIASLNVATLRGVSVKIVIPEKTNLAMVQWASRGQLGQILQRGCRVWLSQAPFDHSKLMVVDGRWSLFGSMNWDPRSLRLNFEFNVECFDETLATELTKIVEERIEESHECTLAFLANRKFCEKLRDGFTRILTPYL